MLTPRVMYEISDSIVRNYDRITSYTSGCRYQVAALELIKASEQEQDPRSSNWTSHGAVDASKKRFSVPFGPNLSKDEKYANQAASWGLEV